MQRSIFAGHNRPIVVNGSPTKRPVEISYIEGIENLTSQLRRLIESIYSRDSRDALRNCLPFRNVSATSLIDAVCTPRCEPAASSR